jgi:hypothetical protein
MESTFCEFDGTTLQSGSISLKIRHSSDILYHIASHFAKFVVPANEVQYRYSSLAIFLEKMLLWLSNDFDVNAFLVPNKNGKTDDRDTEDLSVVIVFKSESDMLQFILTWK